MSSEKIEKSYKVAKWIDTPDAPTSMKRFDETLVEMRSMVEYDWLSNQLKRKSSVKILDICGGWGIGGVALSKAIREKNKGTKLTILDLRRDVREDSKIFSKRVLGEAAKFKLADVTKLGFIDEFDVAVMWGFSTPHFDPWQMTKLVANVSRNLSEDGCFMIEEMDRQYTVLVQSGYQRILSERVTEDRAILSLHAGYDPVKGSFKRLLMNLFERDSTSEEFTFWGIAYLAQLLWMFFEDVDFIERERYRGVLIASRPRKSMNIDSYFCTPPRILNKK